MNPIANLDRPSRRCLHHAMLPQLLACVAVVRLS